MFRCCTGSSAVSAITPIKPNVVDSTKGKVFDEVTDVSKYSEVSESSGRVALVDKATEVRLSRRREVEVRGSYLGPDGGKVVGRRTHPNVGPVSDSNELRRRVVQNIEASYGVPVELKPKSDEARIWSLYGDGWRERESFLTQSRELKGIIEDGSVTLDNRALAVDVWLDIMSYLCSAEGEVYRFLTDEDGGREAHTELKGLLEDILGEVRVLSSESASAKLGRCLIWLEREIERG